MFKNVYHDPQKNKIHLWESKNGKTVYSCLDHKATYYVKDTTETSDITDIYGTRVVKKFAESKKALAQIRKAVKTYESDISEEVKFLHDRYGDSDERTSSSDYNTVALDIEIESQNEFPKPELAKYPINLITINFINRGKVWTIGNRSYTGDSELVKNYECVEDEKQLLTRFIEVWRRSKIDIVTGWNVDTFDLQYIINRCKNLNVDCSDLSPVGKVEVKKNGKCFIAGITILDYIDLYKKFSFTPQPSYKLEYICQYELKKGKKHYEGSIFDIYKNDWNLFVEYNIVDTILIGDLEAKRKFIDLAINLCTESRTPLEKVCSPISLIEGYILKFLHRQNMIMPDRLGSEESEYDESDEDDELLGGYVEAHPGFYKFLLAFDVESLYPHMIMMLNVSPETKIKNPESFDGLIKTPVDGVFYHKDRKGVLADIVETIFKERKTFKTKMFEAEKDGNEELTEYYDSMQMNRKILINCFHKDTDIMTPSGIKKVKDVREGELVYSMNRETRKVELKPVEKTFKGFYDGKLVKFESGRSTLRMTPDHKMIYCQGKSKDIREMVASKVMDLKYGYVPCHKKMDYAHEEYIYLTEYVNHNDYYCVLHKDIDTRKAKQEFQYLFGSDAPIITDIGHGSRKRMKYIIGIPDRSKIDKLEENGYRVHIKHKRDIKCVHQPVKLSMKDFSSFVGWYLAEGCARSGELKRYGRNVSGVSKFISISQYVEANPVNHAEICDLMSRIASKVRITDRSITMSSDAMYDIIVENFGKKFEKRIYKTELGDKLIKEDLHTSMYKGDGNKFRNRYTITTKNRPFMEDYCRLVTELGGTPKVFGDQNSSVYRIVNLKTNVRISESYFSTEDYKDFVYCLSVKDNHTVLVGENGSFMWCGQCVYGVLGNKFFHFYDNDNASVITAGGRELIQFMSQSANSYFEKFLPKTIAKTYPECVISKAPERSVHVVDTDSNYVSIAPFYEAYVAGGGSMEFMDFANDIDSKILTPFFNRLIGMYCTKFNIENKINFKREKIILKMFVQAKKKYITQIIANEKTIYDTPEIKITGLETRKSDLPKFCKDGLLEMFDSMFTEDCPNEEKMLAIVRKYQKIHKNAAVEDIAIPKGVKDYKKYSIDFSEGMRYLPSTPIHNRASINHNYMVQKYRLPFREIDDGAKIKYVFLKENNEIRQNVIAFDDQWPEKFNSLFTIDRNTLFEKSFLEIAQRIFDVLGFRTISLKESKLGNFIKRTE